MTAALPRRRTGRPGQVRQTWARHPRVGLAVEAALAEALRRAEACLAEFVDGVGGGVGERLVPSRRVPHVGRSETVIEVRAG